MVERINISIPDGWQEKIQTLKERQGFNKDFSISKVCQDAIENELENAERRALIWEDGVSYGREYYVNLSPDEQVKIRIMVNNLPRQFPDDILKLLVKSNVITSDNLSKHADMLKYWGTVHERFNFIKGFGSSDDWDEWIGTPPTHEGVEIEDTGIPDPRFGENFLTTADIRYQKVIEIWRKGLLTGIKEKTEGEQK
ncbi:MAG: hypothetical protein ACI8PB_000057 [Desulforhopalus sp.]|jgi:hypothetical protein